MMMVGSGCRMEMTPLFKLKRAIMNKYKCYNCKDTGVIKYIPLENCQLMYGWAMESLWKTKTCKCQER